MTRTVTTTRRFGRGALAAGVLAAAALFVGAIPASAHTQVTPAAPDPGSTVTSGPVTVALTTTDPILEDGQHGIVVRGPGDEETYYGDGCADVSNGTTLSSDVTLGEPGEYTVVWTLVASDGHQQSSDDFAPFTFEWKPDKGEKTAEGQSEIPVCGEDGDSGTSGQDSDGDGGQDSDQQSDQSAQGDDSATGSERGAEEFDDWGDLAWVIVAAGIVFIGAAAVVLIVVRRKMLADAEEDAEEAERADAEEGSGEDRGADSAGDSDSRGGPPTS